MNERTFRHVFLQRSHIRRTSDNATDGDPASAHALACAWPRILNVKMLSKVLAACITIGCTLGRSSLNRNLSEKKPVTHEFCRYVPFLHPLVALYRVREVRGVVSCSMLCILSTSCISVEYHSSSRYCGLVGSKGKSDIMPSNYGVSLVRISNSI